MLFIVSDVNFSYLDKQHIHVCQSCSYILDPILTNNHEKNQETLAATEYHEKNQTSIRIFHRTSLTAFLWAVFVGSQFLTKIPSERNFRIGNQYYYRKYLTNFENCFVYLFIFPYSQMFKINLIRSICLHSKTLVIKN